MQHFSGHLSVDGDGPIYVNGMKSVTSGFSFSLVVIKLKKERSHTHVDNSSYMLFWNEGSNVACGKLFKRPRNIGSSGVSLSEPVSNGSLNKWAPLLISRWAADVPSPIFYFRTWSFSSLFWRNSREHNVHMWVFSLRLFSWDLTCFHYMNRLPFWGSIHTHAKGDQYYF